jgi:Tol biopolymer transport system component
MDGYTQWEGRSLTNITHSSQHDWTPKFSPINNKIVYTTYFPEIDNYDVFIMNDDGSDKINITNSPGYDKYPQFSLDGSFIIYQAWQSGKMEIYFTNILDRNIINLTRNTTAHDIISHGNAISPDGQTIVFTSERDGNRNIYVMNTDGTEQTQLTDHTSHDYEPAFSPDGLSIVFTSERDGNKEIYIMNNEGNNLTNLSNNSAHDWNPRYYPDNQKIVFQSIRDGNWEIYMMNLNGSKQTNLTNHPRTDYSFVVLPLQNP